MPHKTYVRNTAAQHVANTALGVIIGGLLSITAMGYMQYQKASKLEDDFMRWSQENGVYVQDNGPGRLEALELEVFGISRDPRRESENESDQQSE